MTTAVEEPNTETTETRDGRVVAIAGPVVDVEFPPDSLPDVNYAVEMDVELEGETSTVIAEVAQQIGDG
ncbi:MAG: F0F1 ATP synthase subunit beta, partial [Actinomycetota bacterium]|nr:F0F1 ATP synthase subunit beta [Actinomycetota bacterium]